MVAHQTSARLVALALMLPLACSSREPAAAKPKPAPAERSQPDRAPLVTVELALVADPARAALAERFAPDSPLVSAEALLAVRHRIAEPWHIYWQNPGDSGLRTRLKLDATGLEPGPVLYPAPDRFVALGGQVSYGWAGEAALFVPLTKLQADARLSVRSDYLACHESCIPGDASVTATIAELPRADDDALWAMLARLPEPAGDRLTAAWTGPTLHVEPARAELELVEFYPYAHTQAPLESTGLRAGSLELGYRFDAPPPAGAAQGVLHIRQAGQPRWLELAAPWPTP